MPIDDAGWHYDTCREHDLDEACAATHIGMFFAWLAHHGRWPVGEEWLYQSWAACYLPLFRVLRTLADEGRGHLLSLGMTPVVTAQLDDPYCLTGMHHWLANWQLRAQEATTVTDGPDIGYAAPEAMRQFGIREYDTATAAIQRAVDEVTRYLREDERAVVQSVFTATGFSFSGRGQNAAIGFVSLRRGRFEG